jgi:hypothetical protein
VEIGVCPFRLGETLGDQPALLYPFCVGGLFPASVFYGSEVGLDIAPYHYSRQRLEASARI